MSSSTTTDQATRSRTITLTGRRPVTIREHEWPILTSARSDSYQGDPAFHTRAIVNEECDRYELRVRSHADGRAIVYGVLIAAEAPYGHPAGGISWRGGELLDAGDDIAAAIARVGAAGGFPESTISECIANLPPEEL